jgi:dTDP-4-amino-4,6-dideoxygalactose transaminase
MEWRDAFVTSDVPFGDLHREYQALRGELDSALARVLKSGWYILGEEVAGFEDEFASYCGVHECVGVASGADALYLALTALEIGPGDEVITVANACMYQAAAILQAGAHPVFVDVDPFTQTMDPVACTAAVTERTRAIMPVHLFGRLADMRSLNAVAARHKLAVIEDAAQAHGAFGYDDHGRLRRAGAWGDLACFSFYPSKNLGAMGDGGAVTTDSPDLAERLRKLRMYGWSQKYCVTEAGGRNSRLDALQAALLRVKLRHLDGVNHARRERAAWYTELLSDLPLDLPPADPGHVFHLYVIACDDRDGLRRYLQESGIGCDVHYPLPAHLQPAYRWLGYTPGTLPVSERLAHRILSLPLFPQLSRGEIESVVAAVHMRVAS